MAADHLLGRKSPWSELFAPEGMSAAGIGPDEERFREAIGHVNPDALAHAA